MYHISYTLLQLLPTFLHYLNPFLLLMSIYLFSFCITLSFYRVSQSVFVFSFSLLNILLLTFIYLSPFLLNFLLPFPYLHLSFLPALSDFLVSPFLFSSSFFISLTYCLLSIFSPFHSSHFFLF